MKPWSATQSPAALASEKIPAFHAVYDRWIRQCDFPVLGANIIDNATGKPYLKPYEVLERDVNPLQRYYKTCNIYLFHALFFSLNTKKQEKGLPICLFRFKSILLGFRSTF